MAFVPAPNTVKAVLNYLYDDQQAANVFNYYTPQTYTFQDMQYLALSLANIWDTNFKPNQVSEISLVSVVVTDLTTQNGQSYEYTTNLPAAGILNEQPLPANCAAQMIFTTPYRGRAFRGRAFIPGLGEQQNDGSALAQTAKIAWLAAAAALQEIEYGAITWSLVVVSRSYNHIPRQVAECTPVTGYRIGNYIVSQRRRLPGRGV